MPRRHESIEAAAGARQRNEDQRRLERDGSEGIDRDAGRLSLGIDGGHDRYSRRKQAQRVAKFARRETHGRKTSLAARKAGRGLAVRSRFSLFLAETGEIRVVRANLS